MWLRVCSAVQCDAAVNDERGVLLASNNKRAESNIMQNTRNNTRITRINIKNWTNTGPVPFIVSLRAGRRLVFRSLLSKSTSQTLTHTHNQEAKKFKLVSRVFFSCFLSWQKMTAILTQQKKKQRREERERKKMLSQQQPFSIGLRHNIWSNPVWRVKKHIRSSCVSKSETKKNQSFWGFFFM